MPRFTYEEPPPYDPTDPDPVITWPWPQARMMMPFAKSSDVHEQAKHNMAQMEAWLREDPEKFKVLTPKGDPLYRAAKPTPHGNRIRKLDERIRRRGDRIARRHRNKGR